MSQTRATHSLCVCVFVRLLFRQSLLSIQQRVRDRQPVWQRDWSLFCLFSLFFPSLLTRYRENTVLFPESTASATPEIPRIRLYLFEHRLPVFGARICAHDSLTHFSRRSTHCHLGAGTDLQTTPSSHHQPFVRMLKAVTHSFSSPSFFPVHASRSMESGSRITHECKHAVRFKHTRNTGHVQRSIPQMNTLTRSIISRAFMCSVARAHTYAHMYTAYPES